MNTKSVMYLVVGAVLIMLFQNLKEVAVEFVKSTIEPAPAQMQMPFPMFMQPSQERSQSYGGGNFAQK
jgi:hypothetical protein